MHDYQSMLMMITPADEKDLILFDLSPEEKAHIVKQYNRALVNAQGDGTDVAQIFLKPLISDYSKWGDTALVFGLALAKEGQFKRAEQSFAFAIANSLSSEQYLSIAQEAQRMVREDIKNPPPDLPPVNFADKMKNAQMAEGSSPSERKNYQAPILMRANKGVNDFQMASEKERRDVMMRSAAGGDEMASDDLDIENVMTPADRMRKTVRIVVVLLILIILGVLIYFVFIPMGKKLVKAGDNEKRIEFIMDKFQEKKDDPEVAQILKEYAEEFKISEA